MQTNRTRITAADEGWRKFRNRNQMGTGDNITESSKSNKEKLEDERPWPNKKVQKVNCATVLAYPRVSTIPSGHGPTVCLQWD